MHPRTQARYARGEVNPDPALHGHASQSPIPPGARPCRLHVQPRSNTYQLPSCPHPAPPPQVRRYLLAPPAAPARPTSLDSNAAAQTFPSRCRMCLPPPPRPHYHVGRPWSLPCPAPGGPPPLNTRQSAPPGPPAWTLSVFPPPGESLRSSPPLSRPSRGWWRMPPFTRRPALDAVRASPSAWDDPPRPSSRVSAPRNAPAESGWPPTARLALRIRGSLRPALPSLVRGLSPHAPEPPFATSPYCSLS